VFECDGRQLVGARWYPIEVYDGLVVGHGSTLERHSAPESPAPLLAKFPEA
jgi:hypothetical protein